MNFTMDLASQLYNSNEEFPILFDDAWQWLEYSRKDTAKDSFLRQDFIEGVDYIVFRRVPENPNGGRPTEDIRMTVNCFKEWGMLTGSPKGKEIRRYFIECERVAKELSAKKVQASSPEIDIELNRVRFAMNAVLQRHCTPEAIDLTIASFYNRKYPELAEAMEVAKSLIGQAHPQDEAYVTPTQLGKLAAETSLGSLSAIAINKLLEAEGLQFKNPAEGGEPSWCLTEKGKEHGKVLINARNGNGKTIQNTRWLPSVLKVLAGES